MKILAVAGDAGGARALAPVVRALQRRPDTKVYCRAYAAAALVWPAEGIDAEPASKAEEVADFDRLLVGTSLGGEGWELRYLEAATRQGVRSVAVLDFWVHYRERFLDAAGCLVLPDAIAVMDAAASEGLRSAGIPPHLAVVTGHPAFEEAATYREPGRRQEVRARVRGALRLRTEERMVLFVSQPLSQLWTRERLGFLEDEVIQDVLAALEKIATPSAPLVLVVQRHPRESRGTRKLPETTRENLRLIDHPSVLQAHHLLGAVASDLTIGMNSVLLLEAGLAGIPVVSYQPHLRIPDPLPSNASGLTKGVTEPRDLPRVLSNALDRGTSWSLPTQPMPSGAVSNILALLLGPRENLP